MLLYCILGFVFISLLGSLFHFVYDWSGRKKYVAFFVSVNESTWEHLKLAFFPTFLWAIIGLFFGFNNFAFGVFIALLTMLVTIPAIFYTYTHFTKKSILAIDISSFFVGVGLAMILAFVIFSSNPFSAIFNLIGVLGIIAFVIAFAIFTFFPPRNFLFEDPITNKYGIPNNF